MSSTLPLPPKPDFDPVPVRRQRSPYRSPPPRSRPSFGDSYHPDYRPRYRDSRGSSRYDSDARGRDDHRRGDRRYDPSRHYEPDRRDRRDYDRRDRSRSNDNGCDSRSYIRDRGRDYEKRDHDRGRDQREYYDRDRRRNSPPRRRSRSRRRDDRSWSPRRRSSSRDRRWRSPTPPLRRSSPRRRSPDACSSPEVRANVPLLSRPSGPSEPKSPLQPDSMADAARPQRDRSLSPSSPQPPSSSETRLNRTSASPSPQDKGKGKVTPQPAENINEDVKTVDSVSWHSPHPTDQPRKPSPQPPMGTSPTTHVPPHLNLPSNLKRSRTSHTQTNPAASSLSRSSSGFRFPPIPPHEVKEVVKESLTKEIARLASLNMSQKAGAEPLMRVAERSRHELEMSLLELYAAGERRKMAAAQVEEARAGVLGVGHEYSGKVDS